MIKILSNEIPDYLFVRKHGDESPELYSITLKEEFTDEEILNLVLKLQLTGAACVFYGNKEDRYLGLVLWAFSLKLKEVHTIPEIPQIKLTPSQKLVMKDKKKFLSLQDLQKLMKQRRKHWGNQAILVLQRIFQHYNMFPNFFVVDTFYDALLKGYKTNKLTAKKALDNAMVLIEIFELQITKEEEFVNERFC